MPRQKNTNINAEVHGYTNSYFSGNQGDKKSTASYIFMTRGAPISWSLKK